MAYQKKQPIKTPQEWDKIKFQNNLGPQIGGLLHDAVAIIVAEINNKCLDCENGTLMVERIEFWLEKLYDIAEAKKTELTTPQPISNEAAKKAGDDFNKRYENDSKLEEIEQELIRKVDIEK